MTTSVPRKVFRVLAYALLFVILITIAGGAYIYMNSEQFVRKALQEYAHKRNGEATLGGFDFTIENNWQDVIVKLSNVDISITDTVMNQQKEFSVSEFEGKLSLRELIKKNIQVETIHIDSLRFYSHIHKGKPLSFYTKQPTKPAKKELEDVLKFVAQQGTKVNLQQANVLIQDDVKNKRYQFRIDTFNTKLSPTNKSNIYTANSKLDAYINELGFKLSKGSFATNTELVTSMNVVFDTENEIITIEEHPMKLGKEQFETTMQFIKNDNWNFHFLFKNDSTDFKHAKQLVNTHIRKKLGPLVFNNTLKTSIDIKGNFLYGNNPIVIGTFETKNNQLTVNNKYLLNKTDLVGEFANRKQEELSKKEAPLEDFSMQIDTLNTTYNNIPLLVTEVSFESDETIEGEIAAQVQSKGNTSNLNQLLKGSNVKLLGGKFDTKQTLQAELKEGKFLLKHFEGNIQVKQTNVTLPTLKDPITVTNFSADINDNLANVEQLDILFLGKKIALQGNISDYRNLTNGNHLGSLFNFTLKANEISIPDWQQSLNKQQTTNTKKPTTFKIPTSIAVGSKLKFFANTIEMQKQHLTNAKAHLAITNPQEISIHQLAVDAGSIHTSATGSVQFLDETNSSNIYGNLAIKSKGNINDALQFVQPKAWQANDGTFNFSGNLSGSLGNIAGIIEQSEGTLEINNTSFTTPNFLTPIQINQLTTTFASNNATLNKLDFNFFSGNKATVNGRLTDISNLMKKESIQVDLKLNSRKLNIDDLLEQNKQGNQPKEPFDLEQQKKAIYKIGNSIQQYQPSIFIDVDEFQFGAHLFKDVKADLRVDSISQNTFHFNNFSSTYLNSSIQLQGLLSYNEPKQKDDAFNTLTTDLQLQIEGQTKDFNTIFKDKDFTFSKGTYKVDANLSGEIADFADAREQLKLDLLVTDDKIDIIEAESSVDIDSLQINIDGNITTLTTLKLPINEQQTIYADGEIQDFYSLFDFDMNRNPKTELSIYSKSLNINDFLKKFEIELVDSTQNVQKRNNFKNTLRTITRKYDPKVDLQFDSATFKTLRFEDISAHVYAKKDTFYIKNTGLEFPGGFIEVDGSVDISPQLKTPFAIEVIADDLQIDEFMVNKHLLGLEKLDVGGEVYGKIDLLSEVTGEFDENSNLKFKDLVGNLILDIDSLQMINFKPITTNVKFFSKKRFKDIVYAPLQLEIDFDNGNYELYQAEIQSNAYQLFLEGFYRENDKTEVWFSIPIKNIGKKDLDYTPQKTGYALAGKKVFLVYSIIKGEEPKLKFRLSNRKLYKSKDNLHLYKEHKKQWRQERRKYRRKKRKEIRN